MKNENEVKGIFQELKTQVSILGTLVIIAWVITIVDQVIFRGDLKSYGISPREIVGLRGVLFAPFLHGDFGHLIGNTIPFLIFGWLIMLRETKDFMIVSIISMLTAGLGVWLFGRPSFHIGASGVIFGYFGYLLMRGIFEKQFLSIFLSLMVVFGWGGLIFGVLPGNPGISWEGHLFGLIGGVLSAKWLTENKEL